MTSRWRAALVLLWLGLAGPVVGADAVVPSALTQAQLLRSVGSYEAAITVLRQALRRAPDDTALREELGYALILNRQFGAAQHHFNILADRAASAEKRALYRAVLRRIVQEKPVGVSLILNFVPSTNINGGSDAERVDTVFGALPISDASRAKSGWRRTLGLRGFARAVPDARNRLTFTWSVSQEQLSLPGRQPVRNISAGLAWTRFPDWGNYRFAVSRRNEMQGDSTRKDTQASFSATLRLPKDRLLVLGLDHVDKTYTRDSGRNGPDSYASIRHIWHLRGAQSVWLGAILEDSAPELRHQAYSGSVLQIGGQAVLRGGTVLEPVLSVGVRDFVGVFPGVAFARRDTFRQVSISVQDSRVRWRGFSPRLTCLVRKNHSNIALFDARTHECGIQLTRSF